MIAQANTFTNTEPQKWRKRERLQNHSIFLFQKKINNYDIILPRRSLGTMDAMLAVSATRN